MEHDDSNDAPRPRRISPATRFFYGPSASEATRDEPYTKAHNHPHVHEHGDGHTHSHEPDPTGAPPSSAPRRAPAPAVAHWSELPAHERTPSTPASPGSSARVEGGDRPRSQREDSTERASRVARHLHFDCFSGLSGDMIVGALLDLGVPLEPMKKALEALPLEGYSADVVEVVVSSIAATRFVVDVEGAQPFRTWKQIRALLESAPLEDGVRARALRTFEALAVAEGRVHRIPPEEVHFHEVGAVDAIVDIVTASAALDHLGATVTCAPLPMGHGFIKTEHGTIPLPAPAVVELLAGIPTIPAGIQGELVTPTGAALVRANVDSFTQWPAVTPIRTGFGAGTRTMPDRPNLLRAILGTPTARAVEDPRTTATHRLLESNLDDAPGEVLAHATTALLAEGALDAWTEAIGMKKSRPAVKLCALARREDADRLATVMLREAPTLGVRITECARRERPRREVVLETPWGPLPCKIADGDGLPPSAKPEDDAVAALAAKAKIPARIIRDVAMAALAREVLLGVPPRND